MANQLSGRCGLVCRCAPRHRGRKQRNRRRRHLLHCRQWWHLHLVEWWMEQLHVVSRSGCSWSASGARDASWRSRGSSLVAHCAAGHARLASSGLRAGAQCDRRQRRHLRRRRRPCLLLLRRMLRCFLRHLAYRCLALAVLPRWRVQGQLAHRWASGARGQRAVSQRASRLGATSRRLGGSISQCPTTNGRGTRRLSKLLDFRPSSSSSTSKAWTGSAQTTPTPKDGGQKSVWSSLVPCCPALWARPMGVRRPLACSEWAVPSLLLGARCGVGTHDSLVGQDVGCPSGYAQLCVSARTCPARCLCVPATPCGAPP